MTADTKEFLCRRLKDLREKNGFSMEKTAKCLNKANKSSISRVESGKTSYNSLVELAKEYCKLFGLDSIQTKRFLWGDKIVVVDTSALISNPQLIDELNKEYSKVVIPKIVIDELNNIKNRRKGSLSKKAWEIIRDIGIGSNIIKREYTGNPNEKNNDLKIIDIAKNVSNEFGSKVDIITNDADYSAYLKGNEVISSLHLYEYLATKQEIVNMSKIKEIDNYFSSNYDKVQSPTLQEVNAYFDNGNTLIISTIRNKKHSFEEKKEKIKWLIANGADVNKRDCSHRYFPPISHAIQMNDYNIFIFLLKECHANPNIASRNPYDAGKIRQKNEGNMPLMIAAWEGRDLFVKALCEDSRTSINQQDANGFTALIKACANKHFKCRDLLLKYGADKKIVDINGKTYEDYMKEAIELGPLKTRGRSGK